MIDRHISRRSIQLLREDIARKIAAGEVIDRPYSVIRELIDNAIDASADTIDVYLENGGMSLMRVIDNGCGMSKEDLELCYLPHSTSKISTLEDLDHISSLGFRGEALASIAACARLKITSRQNISTDTINTEDITPQTLQVDNGKKLSLTPSAGKPGTITEVKDLFYAMPGRKKFLKSKRAEGTACRAIFQEKALAFPDISFRLFIENELKLFLPATALLERTAAIYDKLVPSQYLREHSDHAENFTCKIILTTPDFFRKDRRGIKVYVNRRLIDEFSFIHAIEHAYRSHLPGGAFPGAFLFITINPELVDFNVHPAKKEAKFKNLPEIHHQIQQAIKSFLHSHNIPNITTGFKKEADEFFYNHQGNTNKLMLEENSSYQKSYQPAVQSSNLQNENVCLPFTYLGQVFNLFLVAETEAGVYFIDQHAAHEALLYEQMVKSADKSQPLLIPISLQIEKNEETLLEQHRDGLAALGIDIYQAGTGTWEITGLPAGCKQMEQEIMEFITTQMGSADNLKVKLFSDLACKKAIKDGSLIDLQQARNLIAWVLQSENRRCPHGRPLLYRVTRNDLYKHVGRILH